MTRPVSHPAADRYTPPATIGHPHMTCEQFADMLRRQQADTGAEDVDVDTLVADCAAAVREGARERGIRAAILAEAAGMTDDEFLRVMRANLRALRADLQLASVDPAVQRRVERLTFAVTARMDRT